MKTCVRVGVIGLGRRWRRRYKPALTALADRFSIAAVSDPVLVRAAAEARALGCPALGPVALLERKDIDAILLADRRWFGLWPLELACTIGKPVLCAVPLEADLAHAGQVVERVRAAGLPVVIEMATRVSGELAQLRRLVEAQLGSPRLARVEVTKPTAADGTPRHVGSLVPLVDWCVSLFQSEPIQATTAKLGSMQVWTLDFGTGRRAEILSRSAPGGRHIRFEVLASGGRAAVELPGLLAWTGKDGQHVQLLRRRRSVGRELLLSFHHMVATGAPAEPALADVYRMFRWLYPE